MCNKITILGKPGCTKCNKMEKILKTRGLCTNLEYLEEVGTHTIDDIKIEVSEDTHFPLYIYDDKLYMNYSELNKQLKYFTKNEH